MSFVWVIIGAVVVLGLLSGGSKKGERKPRTSGSSVRIDRPHIIDSDDYECSVCHRRFHKNVMVFPFCGTRFAERIEDTEEWDEEEDELEAWDEEDGV